VFEFLENLDIDFISHRSIPNTSKVSDLYLPLLDLWIELDGINRERKKKWLGSDYDYWISKLKLYDIQKFKYKIFYSTSEFESFIKENYTLS